MENHESSRPEEMHLGKAERRALKKQRAKEKHLLEKKEKTSKAYLGWASFILLTALVLAGIYFLATYNALPPIENPLAITQNDHIKGTENGKATLIEYSDLQCPACKNYYPMVKKLAEIFEENLTIVYRHYPLKSIHRNAEQAALATEAATKQGKFWEMHDKLFVTQSEWSNLGNAKNRFIEYADDLGLDTDQFESDMKSSEAKTKVKTDTATGNMVNIQGTPSFFLNGKKIDNPRGEEAFTSLIREAIENSN